MNRPPHGPPAIGAPRRRFCEAAAALFAGALLPGASRAAELRAWTGRKAPPLVAPTLEGRTVDLSTWRGRVVVVNFWATWCAPCVKELPSLVRLAAKLGSSGSVLLVNYGEDAARVGAFLQKLPLDLPLVLDREMKIALDWGVKVLPTSFVVDPGGEGRFTAVGDVDWAAAEVVDRILALARR